MCDALADVTTVMPSTIQTLQGPGNQAIRGPGLESEHRSPILENVTHEFDAFENDDPTFNSLADEPRDVVVASRNREPLRDITREQAFAGNSTARMASVEQHQRVTKINWKPLSGR